MSTCVLNSRDSMAAIPDAYKPTTQASDTTESTSDLLQVGVIYR
jgi:hypothetical protein